MNLKKVNDLFGISLSLMGFFKVLLIVLVMVQSGSAATALVTGGNAPEYSFETFSTILGLAQLVLAAGSIVMIFVNIKKYPDVIVGYIIGLFALALEFILPSIIFFVYVFVECGLYIKAGNIIRNKEFKLFGIDNDSNVNVESTDWFYNDKKE